jgi:protein-tyrosine-phosphatase
VPPETTMTRVLCVCSGNTCRSPMLQTLLRSVLADAKRSDVQVESAGTGASTGDPASRGAQAAMERRGLSLTEHGSRHVQSLDLTAYDRFLCMTSAHAAAIRSLGVPPQRITVVNADDGGVPDPWGGDDRAYEATAQVLAHAAHTHAAAF